MTNTLKYDEDLYVGSGFYGGDMDGEYNHSIEKIVRCRKSHICTGCGKEIPIGDKALYEKAYGSEGPVSCYTCIVCIESWLEESGQVDIEK